MKISYKEITHPIHPHHKIKLEYTEIPYSLYSCHQKCCAGQFDLHKACAVPPPIVNIPFYRNCNFEFHHHPPGEEKRICDASQLYLCRKLSGACHRCGGKGHGWSYRSRCKTYNLHLSCVKELLVESWEAMYLKVDENKVREMQSRIPSLKGTLANHHGGIRGGKVTRCCQMAGGAIRLIVSAILGDPTSIIAAVVGGFISK
ncbi:hypothetical protein POPTR_009G170201v4 [Populus trichocarpa]|uniref:Uncharacterized protein n=1 Tax=Populus trichocarpa TaxID=3694 RepID=A0ACC0SIW5_POPTR|nr:hypothetical protein BDE02_09G151200 [Populus trichocarpa]KAI9389113.1 hypothetical protein POPTR_009G170201v4 [Populus trichocarpa]